jgi:DNA-binding transcriptional MerR regulator
MKVEVNMEKNRMSLSELAERSGVPARTIRYYISRGLLPGPDKAGRDAGYSNEHITKLEQIRQQQQKGSHLREISVSLSSEPVELPAAVSWLSYEIAEDVKIIVRDSLPPWRMNHLRRAIMKFTQEIQIQNEEKTYGNHD